MPARTGVFEVVYSPVGYSVRWTGLEGEVCFVKREEMSEETLERLLDKISDAADHMSKTRRQNMSAGGTKVIRKATKPGA